MAVTGVAAVILSNVSSPPKYHEDNSDWLWVLENDSVEFYENSYVEDQGPPYWAEIYTRIHGSHHIGPFETKEAAFAVIKVLVDKNTMGYIIRPHDD